MLFTIRIYFLDTVDTINMGERSWFQR